MTPMVVYMVAMEVLVLEGLDLEDPQYLHMDLLVLEELSHHMEVLLGPMEDHQFLRMDLLLLEELFHLTEELLDPMEDHQFLPMDLVVLEELSHPMEVPLELMAGLQFLLMDQLLLEELSRHTEVPLEPLEDLDLDQLLMVESVLLLTVVLWVVLVEDLLVVLDLLPMADMDMHLLTTNSAMEFKQLTIMARLSLDDMKSALLMAQLVTTMSTLPTASSLSTTMLLGLPFRLMELLLTLPTVEMFFYHKIYVTFIINKLFIQQISNFLSMLNTHQQTKQKIIAY